jgi:hypothetical protein
MSEIELRTKIKQLTEELAQSKKLLFVRRLSKMLDKSIQTIILDDSESKRLTHIPTLVDNHSELVSKVDSKIVKNIVFKTNKKTEEWSISYTHETKYYTSLNYLYNESDNEVEIENVVENVVDKEINTQYREKVTNITFGNIGNRKYYINGGIKLEVFKSSSGEIRITNPEYDYEIDIEEHRELIKGYSLNKDIPEALAINVFIYMTSNNWNNEDIIKYFSIV